MSAMFKLSKTESTLLTSVAVLIAITVIFEDPKSGIISGMLTALFSHIKSLHNQFTKRNCEALAESKKLSEDCVSRLHLNDSFLADDWLFDSLEKIIKSNDNAQRHPYLLELARRKISQGIEEAKITLNGRVQKFLGYQEELKRQSFLTDIVGKSTVHVRAVSNYDPVNWTAFWKNKKSSEKYIQANISAAQRGVDIERIFLLPDKILEGVDQENSDNVRSIMLLMVNKNRNLQIKCLSTDRMPPELAHYKDAGFLVADDMFVAVSYHPSQLEHPHKEGGYIAISIREEIKKYEGIFDILEDGARPAEEFPFWHKQYKRQAKPSTPRT